MNACRDDTPEDQEWDDEEADLGDGFDDEG